MLSRKCAEWIIRPELAATIVDGELQGSDIWDDVCTFAGGWCNDTSVFLMWDAMGRPDESEYVEPEYNLERDPERRRAIIANARISAMAQLVADDLISVVEEILVRDGRTIRPTSEAEAETVGWVENGCDALGFTGEGHLIKTERK
nr:MAG TPA: hypothetical protein [Caudoviricetes sp.]